MRAVKGAASALVIVALLVAEAATQNVPPATGTIVGTVIDASSQRPIPGAVVTLMGPGVNRAVMVEPRGRFAFRDLPRGAYLVRATRLGWDEGAYGRLRPRGSDLPIELADGERVGGIAIPLWRHGAIAGVVRDEHGEPFAGLEVRALLKSFRTGDVRWLTQSSTHTDDRGMYRLGSLTPGEYTVVIPSTNTLSPAPLGRVGMVPHAVAVNGRMLTAGIPIAPGRERGRPFVYRTTFYPNALTSSQATSMMVRPGEERAGVDFELAPVPTFSVSGVLTNFSGRSGSYSVELMRAAENAAGRIASVSDIRVGLSRADPSGHFLLFGIPAGHYILRAVPENPGPFVNSHRAKQAVVVGDADVNELAVPLQPDATVSGRVEFEGGVPPDPDRLTSIPISVEAVDPRDGTSRIGRVSANGRFSTMGVPGGDYVIMAPGTPPGWSLKTVTVAGRDVTDRVVAITGDVDDVVMTFTNMTTEVRGRISSGGGADPSAYTVFVFPRGGLDEGQLTWANGSRRFRQARVGKDGTYVFARLPAGTYAVAAVPEEVAADWPSGSFLTLLAGLATPLQIAEGEKRTLDLDVVRIAR